MMTRKDYEKAAEIALNHQGRVDPDAAAAVREAFVTLFQGDNPQFDANRFRMACMPKPARSAR